MRLMGYETYFILGLFLNFLEFLFMISTDIQMYPSIYINLNQTILILFIIVLN